MVGEWDAVLGHLLFHKSLIDEDSDGRKIDDYMAMVRQLETGMTVIASDPIEKAISIAFQLVEEHGFNPWDIDLSEFTKMYMKRIRNEPEVNFVIAGRLVLMAWSILKMQSEEVLSLAEPPAPAEPMEWDAGIYVMPEDIDYRETVLGADVPLLQEAVRGQQTRPVTLMELIDAFDEARQEIKLQETLKKLRDGQKPNEPKSIEDKVHRENMQEDIAMTWERISQFGVEPIPLTALHTGDPWDRIAVFTSVLFLAKHKRVRLEQKSLPYGEIYVSNIELRRLMEQNAQATVQFDAMQMIASPAAASLMAAAPREIAEGVTASAQVEMTGQAQTAVYEVSNIGRA
ncbi:MAG: segregation/condensation protein A [Methanobacteriota archaeon]